MGRFHQDSFPGESNAYREARDALLAAEMDLRKQVEAVAELRRTLPPGGELKEDYVFDEGDDAHETQFSELFENGHEILLLYSFMYSGDGDPCPMCTAFLDSLNGNAPHIRQRVGLAIVAKAPIDKIQAFARSRGWNNLRMLSSGRNSYNADYFGERPEFGQIPSMNVFRNTANGIRHLYNTELFFVPPEDGQHPRHMDMMWPLWNVFDLTPEGRGADWFPGRDY